MRKTSWFAAGLLLAANFVSAQQAFRPANIWPGEAEEMPLRHAVMAATPWLAVAGMDLSLATHRNSPGGSYWHFTQTYQGIPVWGGGIKAMLNPAGRICGVMDHLHRAAPPAAAQWPARDTAALRSRWAQAYSANLSPLSAVWHAGGGALRPAWLCRSFDNEGISHELLIDANSGELLQQELRTAFRHFAFADSNGRGRVFSPNPSTRAQLPYGGALVDNNNAHHPAFDPLTDTVALRELHYDGNLFHLQGPFVRIEQISGNSVQPVTSPNGDFFFTRNQSGFEDVMAYYHIDTFQRHVQRLGFSNLWAIPLRVDTHARSSDQSSFTPNGANSYILYGEGGVDDAEDADVIIHEYGHALSEAAAPNTRTGTQRRGLDEGYGDYFAAAYSQDVNPGYGWELIMNWDGHNEFWPGRSAAIQSTYKSSENDIYKIGELWATVMMIIRQSVGAEVTDRLQLQALYGSVPGMSVPDAAQLVILADSNLYGGIHVPTLRFHFCEKGVLSGGICVVGLEELPAQPSAAGGRIWQEGAALHLHWDGALPAAIRLTDMQGRVVFNTTLSQRDIQFPLRIAPGIYTLQVLAPAGLQRNFRLPWAAGH